MKRKISIFLITTLTYLFVGCESFVEVDVPPHQLSSANAFNDESSATAAVTGIYASLSTGFMSANMQFAMEYYFGDLVYNGTNDNYVQFMDRSIQVNNSFVSTFWNGLYQYIYHCNAAIEALNNSTLNTETRNRLLGECLFLRAFFYSYLVKCWGGVPLILTTDWQVNQSLGRSSENEIYDQIVADLEVSKVLLEPYPSNINTRANYYGVASLLSRMYLLLEDWEQAEENATIVIENPVLAIESIENVFLLNSGETVFQTTSVNAFYLNTNLGQQINPNTSTSIPNVGVPSNFENQFLEDDLRRLNWMNSNTVQDALYFYPYKYKEVFGSMERRENLIVLRLAEQYLNRARARFELGNNDAALSDLNAVRLRASTPYSEVSQENIQREVRLEFFSEWGLANKDMELFWPIPLVQLETNPALIQNQGY